MRSYAIPYRYESEGEGYASETETVMMEDEFGNRWYEDVEVEPDFPDPYARGSTSLRPHTLVA